MQGMNFEGIHQNSKAYINTLMTKVYGNIYKPEQVEDIILWTERRNEYPNIGTESVQMSTMKYIADNIYWINICLFVNADFRACFDDAITIEKALLQVNDMEYQDFRDDMTLDEEKIPGDKTFSVNLTHYNDKIENVVTNLTDVAKTMFYKAGMTEVYNDLAKSLDSDRKLFGDISYILHNMMYVINSFNRNGVFRKYVRLVVDSVKQQLS